MHKKPWKNPIKDYTRLLRRIRRAPIDLISRNLAIETLKSNYRNNDLKYDHKKVRDINGILKNILVHQEYRSIPTLLARIYARDENIPARIVEFNNIENWKLAPYWPQVHLIEEFSSDEKRNSHYRSQIMSELETPFSLVEHFKLDREDIDLKPIPRNILANKPANTKQIIEEIRQYYKFILQHQNKLTKFKILPFEAILPLSSLGTPIATVRRQNIVKKAIENAKITLMTYYRPLKKKDYTQLFEQLANGTFQPNPIYYSTKGKDNFDHRLKPQHIKLPSTTLPTLSRKKLINPIEIQEYTRQYLMTTIYESEEGIKPNNFPDLYSSSSPKSPNFEMSVPKEILEKQKPLTI